MLPEMSLDRLMHRLSECPPDFLAEPCLRGKGAVRVDAVVHDLVLDLAGVSLSELELRAFTGPGKGDRDWLRLVLVGCWLLADESLRQPPPPPARVQAFLDDRLRELATVVNADAFVGDPDRREELVRLCLRSLGIEPPGETMEQAADRLATLDSVRRAQLIEATRAQQERARELRERLRAEKAREAAARAASDW
ncbi:MAG: hypothetical protein KA419_09305 [Acidobacteria bacterium]|nr:hypothetical protein [Acidobacteriota bacterium]